MESGTNAFLEVLRMAFGDLAPGWVLVLGSTLLAVGGALTLIAVNALFATWLERKVSGHIQCRFGPMYVGGWHGWAQSLADGIKLITKEDLVPRGGDRTLFMFAPALLLAAIFGAMVAFPITPQIYFANVDLGVYFILGLSALTTIGVVMAGWASNSKWSLYGAMREAAQVVAYEVPLGISLLVPVMVAGTFNLLDASAEQSGWYGMHWFIFRNPFMIPALVLFFVASLAETKRAPFDLPEAESELVAGFMTEYSGIRWSFFFMEEYAAMLLMSAVAAVFFLGGFESPLTHFANALWGDKLFVTADGVTSLSLAGLPYHLAAGLTLILKALFGVFMMMWLRWTLPRIRIDQVMTMGYKYLTPLSLLCVLGAGIWEAIRS